MLLSILIPVFNERTVVEASLGAVLGAPLPEGLDRELVVVDDCSTDGTATILERLAAAEPRIRLFRHAVNRGKSAAIRTAIEQARGDFSLFQDADLEYDPREYPRLLKPLLEGHADCVFGSRYLAGEQTRVLPFWHTQINKFITLACNMFANLNVTDVETCYKVFRTDLLKSIPIRSERFGLEPELAMKVAKRRLRLYEVPISYHGRTYEEGKKIGWKDGLEALGVILRFWLIDDLYVEPHGKGALVNLTRTPAYLNWITSLVRPRLGDRVLEIGAGNGAFAGLLMGRRTCYVAGEADPFYLHALRNRFLRAPSVRVCALDAESGDLSGAGPEPFDSALCLNVLEGMERPERTLQGVQKALAPGGVLVVLAPQHPRLYGSVDETLGQMRRFARARLVRLIEESGFAVTGVRQINKAGVPMWWLQSRILRRRRLSKITLKLFDKSVWLWRLLDRVLPWPGLSLLIFARRRE